MRHRKGGHKLGKSMAHRIALGRNILRELFRRGKIVTTLAKAKAYAPMADKMITIAKKAEEKVHKMEERLKTASRGDVTEELQLQIQKQSQAIRVASIRLAMTKIPDKDTVHRIFHTIAPLYAERKGGYTSVIRMNKIRVGDNTRLAVLKLVADVPVEAEKTKEVKTTKAK